MTDHTQRRSSVFWNVLSAVAGAKECEVADLTEPLYTAVDPDALERICGNGHSDRSTGLVTFEWHQCLVEVTFGGAVRAHALSPPARPVEARNGE